MGVMDRDEFKNIILLNILFVQDVVEQGKFLCPNLPKYAQLATDKEGYRNMILANMFFVMVVAVMVGHGQS